MSKQSKPHHSPPLCHFDKGKGRANLTARGAADNLLEDHYVPLSFLSRIKKCLVTRQSIFNCLRPHHSKAGPVEPQGATRTPPSAGPTHAQRAQLLSEQPGRTNHLYLMIQMLIRVSQKYTNEKWNPLRISLGINLNRSKRIIEFDHV